ncbi:hypothetical protein DS831_04545 [Bombilactobacillus bombi]|uniref:Uncharacterized protein n=1 Tax=Bombilactobacillus bombi TaxID=1303590 RepID=A0A3R6VKL2_9LACO|nr:hypothetical protein [Bombilactobacillus bombi]RHW51295.1 hypothetical protein DS831_04545 [Bombilactobacillus bombi]
MVWYVSIPDCILGIVIGTFGTLAVQDFIKGVKRNHSVLKFVRSWFSEDTKKVEPTGMSSTDIKNFNKQILSLNLEERKRIVK